MGKGGASPEDQVGIHWVQVKVRLFADAAGQGPIMTSPLTSNESRLWPKKGNSPPSVNGFRNGWNPNLP